MKNSSWRVVACALLAVALWAGVASSGNAEPAGADHGWVEADVAFACSASRVNWGASGASRDREEQPMPSAGLDWRMRALMIGGAGNVAEAVRTRLPVLSVIVAERGSDLGHWLALLTRDGM
jgi:hypothetical protein